MSNRGFVSFLLAAALVGLMLAAAFTVERVNRERDFSDALAGERMFVLLDGGRAALAASGSHALEQVDKGTTGGTGANRPVWENAVALADAYGQAGGTGLGAGAGMDAEIVFWCADECPLKQGGLHGGLRNQSATGASVPPGARALGDRACQDYFDVEVGVAEVALSNGSTVNVTFKTLQFANGNGVVGVSAWDKRSGWLADSCVSRDIMLYSE